MEALHLNIATSDYDHFRDIALGRVGVDGARVNYQIYPIEEVFFRFVRYREWDVSEVSFAKFAAIMADGTPDIIGLPVFPSRMFRLASVYVNRKGSIRSGKDLAGKRIGVPEWAQTAAIYTRGWLSDDLGIPLGAVKWFQAGLNQPGRGEQVKFNLPDDVELRAVAGSSLRDMLRDGEIDAFFSARPPDGMDGPYADIVPMLTDARSEEATYFERTGVLPIMHTIAMRREVYERNPWIARNLYKAFSEARARSLERIFDRQASRIFVPWLPDLAEDGRKLLGASYFPYGIEENRTCLEVYLKWCFEQGITKRRLAPEELFAKEIGAAYRV
ncbi:MAG: hypothetical protein RLZ98_1278 [Pseudomonadota bacterium]|jgi:4,5-dihydroxyphthalate decarboxylase